MPEPMEDGLGEIGLGDALVLRLAGGSERCLHDQAVASVASSTRGGHWARPISKGRAGIFDVAPTIGMIYLTVRDQNGKSILREN